VFGGERSGHFFIRDNYYGFDDGVFSAATLLAYLSEQNKLFSKIIAETPSYVISPTIHVHCPEEVKYVIEQKLIDTFKKKYTVNDVNGAKVLFNNGWGLVRASSNEPKLVLVFEADTADRLQEYKQVFREVLSQFPEIDSHWENE
jgi:phosphomannomutase/phosphoglucomutase